MALSPIYPWNREKLDVTTQRDLRQRFKSLKEWRAEYKKYCDEEENGEGKHVRECNVLLDGCLFH